MNKLKTFDELIVLCDICKKFPENNCSHPCCKTHKRVKVEASKWVESYRMREAGMGNIVAREFQRFFDIKEVKNGN